MTNLPCVLDDPEVVNTIQRSLEEDIGQGDVTTLSLVPKDSRTIVDLVARSKCVISGNDVAKAVFQSLSSDIDYKVVVPDGGIAHEEGVIARIGGNARAILTGERTALNFMQRMCGIATMTRSFTDKTRQYDVIILDTRKTTPTLRKFEKYAVLCGGGQNHRMGLYDRVLIKDNHRRLWRDGDMARLDQAVEEARRKFPGIAIEVEVENITELESAIAASPDWLLLDNMSPRLMTQCVEIVGGRAKLEASGGITMANIEDVAASGVDAISLGCLTHSAPAMDLSLEVADNE